RDSVVRGPKGTPRNERLTQRQDARHGVDLGRLEGLLEAHLRQNGGDAARQHGLAAPRRSWVPLERQSAGTLRSASVPIRRRFSSVTDSTHAASRSRATGAGTFLMRLGKSAAIFSSRSRSACLSVRLGLAFAACSARPTSAICALMPD